MWVFLLLPLVLIVLVLHLYFFHFGFYFVYQYILCWRTHLKCKCRFFSPSLAEMRSSCQRSQFLMKIEHVHSSRITGFDLSFMIMALIMGALPISFVKVLSLPFPLSQSSMAFSLVSQSHFIENEMHPQPTAQFASQKCTYYNTIRFIERQTFDQLKRFQQIELHEMLLITLIVFQA